MVSLLSTARISEPERSVPCWIESCVEVTEGTQSPELFRRWAAVATVAGALERKVHVKAFKRTLYANLYILLVGGPGVGKTDALRNVREYWAELPDLHIAPSSVSRASLADSLAAAKRHILRPTELPAFEEFNSLQVCSTEFGTFLSAYESEFMSTLNDLYDCVPYNEKKRSMKEELAIAKPQLSIVAATTPAWLCGSLPETAWAEGFSSRLLLVFSQERIKMDPFALAEAANPLQNLLFADLKQIHNLHGTMMFDEEFIPLFRDWYMEDCPPVPEHPKLEHYLPRRHIHFLKLCMVFSASRSNEMLLRSEDFHAARNLLIDTEALMPEVFKAMKYNSDSNIMDEVYSFVWQMFAKEQKGISEHRVRRFLGERAPAYAVDKILDSMLKSRILLVESVGGGEGGMNTFKPAPKVEL